MPAARTPRFPRLSARLAGLVDGVPSSNTVFDIGCDHALVSIALTLQGKCRYAYAVDRRAGPLAVAADRIQRYSLLGRIMPVLADGLDGMYPASDDTVVIAGMGGNEIARILERRPELPAGTAVVLQPMKSAAELRIWLSENGFALEAESLCQDGRHIYTVLLARCQGAASLPPITLEDAYAGSCILRDRPPLFHEYLDKVIARLKKASRTNPALAGVAANLAALREEGDQR